MNDASTDFLQQSWQRAWSGLNASGDGYSIYAALLARHAEPQRHYHTRQHLAECLVLFDETRHLAKHPAAVEIALWFHDAIYEVKESGNEQRSADWAREELLAHQVESALADEIYALIMVTQHTALPSAADEMLLVDIDLSILGASDERFAEFEQQIRDEYSFVPKWIFKRKRKEILKSFLERPSIYSTPYFKEKLEQLARANLTKAVA